MRSPNYSESYKKNKKLLKGVMHEKRQRFTAKIKNELIEKFKGKCFYCGQKLKEMHIDHLIPITVGGRHTMKNFVLACSWCNISKKNKHPISHLWNLHKNKTKISPAALKLLTKCINSQSIGDFIPTAEKWVKSKSKSAVELKSLLEEGITFEKWERETLKNTSRKRFKNRT